MRSLTALIASQTVLPPLAALRKQSFLRYMVTSMPWERFRGAKDSKVARMDSISVTNQQSAFLNADCGCDGRRP